MRYLVVANTGWEISPILAWIVICIAGAVIFCGALYALLAAIDAAFDTGDTK